MNTAQFITYSSYREYPPEEMIARASQWRAELQRRRTVRSFSNRPVAREVIEQCLLAAGTAPSGANLQPWHFVVVTDPAIKRPIRVAAEKEEHAFYLNSGWLMKGSVKAFGRPRDRIRRLLLSSVTAGSHPPVGSGSVAGRQNRTGQLLGWRGGAP